MKRFLCFLWTAALLMAVTAGEASSTGTGLFSDLDPSFKTAYLEVLLSSQNGIAAFERIQAENRQFNEEGGMQSVLLYDLDLDGTDELVIFFVPEEGDPLFSEWEEAAVRIYTYRNGTAVELFSRYIVLQGGDSCYTDVDLEGGSPYLYIYASELGHTEEMYRLTLHGSDPVSSRVAARFSCWYEEGEDKPCTEEYLVEDLPVSAEKSQACINAHLAKRTILLSTITDTSFGRTFSEALRFLSDMSDDPEPPASPGSGTETSATGISLPNTQAGPVAARTSKRKVNVREKPDITSQMVDKLISEGTEVLLLSRAFDPEGTLWYRVRLPDSREGYIRGDLVTPLDPGADALPLGGE